MKIYADNHLVDAAIDDLAAPSASAAANTDAGRRGGAGGLGDH